jgi:hypothetical protein
MSAEPNLDHWQHGGPPEPSQLMHVIGEVFPLAADEAGIWLLSGDYPWSSLPVPADSSPVAECEWELVQHGAVAVLGPHQTSSRVDGAALITTHVAVIACPGPVRASWPQAKPVSPRIAKRVGKPPTHAANKAPEEVRQWDALTHGLRHLAFQLGPAGDATLAEALDGNWGEHLAAWTPTLYQMYDRVHESA